MKGILKWLIGIVVVLAVLAVAAIVLVPMFVDVQQYKPRLEEIVSQQTGRPFSMGDDMDISVFPWVGVRLSDLQLGSPRGFAAKEMVTVRSFEVHLKVMPLLSKNVEVRSFVVDTPRIFLERRKDGLANWENLGTGTKQKEKTGTAPKDGALPIASLTVANFAIQDGLVSFTDKAAGVEKQISDLNVNLSDISLEDPVKLSMSALVDGKPLALEGSIGPVGKTPGKSDILFDLAAKAFGVMDVKLAGTLKDPSGRQQVDMNLAVAPFSLRKLMEELDQPFFMETADPDVFKKLSLKTKISGNADAVSFSEGHLTLDDSSLDFSAGAKAFEKPDIAFDLVLDRIDLDRYLPPQAQEKTTSSTETSGGTGEKPAAAKPDYTPLRKLVMDGKLKIGRLTAANLSLSDMTAHVQAKNGLITVDPLSLDLYEGSLAATLDLDVRQNLPKTQIALDLKGVQAGPLIQDAAAKKIITGTVQAATNLDMTGDTPDSIKKTLAGTGEITFTDGAIEGIDIAGMVRNAASKVGLGKQPEQKPRTDFAKLEVPFTVGKGVLDVTQAGMMSPLLRVSAAGKAFLVKEELDFRVEPKIVGTLKGQGDTKDRSGIMVPLLITGPFASPKIRPDLAGMLGSGIPDADTLKEAIDTKKLPDTKSLEEEGKKVLKNLMPGLKN
ncbi:MAG: AsmA family protein [Desulfotignum sp.]|jgi:AsmA protein|nr:AsmA family protein [Desulfotignum sp.]